MSAVEAGPQHPRLLGSVRAAYVAGVILFGWAVLQFYTRETGFTSLIAIGDAINDRQVTQLRNVPHYVYEDSAGYDGAYYVQLALNPTLENPELGKAIDNFSYRARRILFCWVAWLGGLGQPAWIVQAHALLNVVSWFGLAWILLRWFPATSWENFFRWCGVMFSHGLCMSVRDSLVDGPALFLIAVALAAWEDGRPRRAAAFLALAGLGRETSLMAATAFAPNARRDRAGWWRCVHMTVVAALPVLAWVLYLRWRFGPAGETGLNNFTLPLAGLAEKWGTTLADVTAAPEKAINRATFAVVIALTIQFLFFMLRWRPREMWWRIGAIYGVLLMFVSTPVWEGYPGAAARVLLPMTLAFNVLVPRGRVWLGLLIAGNLTIVAGYREFDPPAREFFHVSATPELANKLSVQLAGGWYGAEETTGLTWRWSSGPATLRLRNNSGIPVVVVCAGHAASALDERVFRVRSGPPNAARKDDMLVWGGALAGHPVQFQFGLTIPPGETLLTFSTDKPAHSIGDDPRKMAFKIFNLEIVVKPGPGHR